MLSKKIANYLLALSFTDLPKEVVAFTKACILDYYASLIKGKDSVPVRIMQEVVEELGGHPQATAITGLKTSVANTAFVNGGASHVVELDDIHKRSIVHAATVIMPAAIAIAEWKNYSGKDLITAIVAGYEIAFRIGEAVSPSHYYYFHNTATCGTFGATVAISKLLGHNEAQIIAALGSAGTQAAGLWEFIEDGAMSKQLHPGKAGMNGVMSGLLAGKGFTGATAILEGRRGFFEAMTKEYDAERITEGLGTEFKILENAFKIHASCRHTHAVMDLLCGYVQQQPRNWDELEQLTIRTYQVALDITDDPDPKTIYAAKFSMQFCAALSMALGKGDFETFNEHTLTSESIAALMKKIVVQVDKEIDARYPEQWGAAVDIAWRNGQRESYETDYPVGDPENPVSLAMLIEKFRLLTPNYSATKQQAIIETILTIEQHNVQDLIAAVHAENPI